MTTAATESPVWRLVSECRSRPTISPVVLNFSPELIFSSLNNDLNPLIIGYKYDLSVVDANAGLGETLTMDIFFQTGGAVSDSQCRFQITTNPLDVVVVE